MITDELGKQLHDRATRGEALTEDEESLLERWYALQDQAESKVLGLTDERQTITTLQTQVEAALAQLTIATKRIQETSPENDVIRHDIALLRQQLSEQIVSHPAG